MSPFRQIRRYPFPPLLLSPSLALILLFSGCRDIERPSILSLILGGSGGGRIGVVSSDFGAAGRFSILSAEGVALPGYSIIHSDAVARYQNNRVIIINRLNRDNIQILNPQIAFLTETEFSVGAGTNPQDFIEAGPDRAYLSLYNRPEIRIIHPLSGAHQGSIDLGYLAESTPFPDGLPEISGLHLEGDRLYAALQRLNRNDPSGFFPPTDASFLVEIETVTNLVLAVHQFPGLNPFGKMRRVVFEGAPHLIVACPGRMGYLSQLDGGVVAFNLTTRSFRPGFLFSEATAGGDILEAVLKNDQVGYALVLDVALNKYLLRFNPQSGLLESTLTSFRADQGNLSGLVLSAAGLLFVGNADFTNPGVMIFDTNRGDTLLTPAPVSVGLRPTDLVELAP